MNYSLTLGQKVSKGNSWMQIKLKMQQKYKNNQKETFLFLFLLKLRFITGLKHVSSRYHDNGPAHIQDPVADGEAEPQVQVEPRLRQNRLGLHGTGRPAAGVRGRFV